MPKHKYTQSELLNMFYEPPPQFSQELQDELNEIVMREGMRRVLIDLKNRTRGG